MSPDKPRVASEDPHEPVSVHFDHDPYVGQLPETPRPQKREEPDESENPGAAAEIAGMRWHRREADARDRMASEWTDRPADRTKLIDLLERLFDRLDRSVREAVLVRVAAAVAGVFAPVCGPAVVEATYWATGVVRALRSVNDGRGFILPIQLAGLGNAYDLQLSFRLCDEHPPPFPSLGLEVSPNLQRVPIPDALQVNGVEPVRFIALAAEEPGILSPNRGYDIETLLELAAARAHATGSTDGENWAPLVVEYLRPVRRAGLVVVQSSPRQPPEVWTVEVAPPRRRRRRTCQ